MKLTRLDKNVVYNIGSFDKITRPGDRLLIKRLVGLISYAFQNPVLDEDIFGNKILTVEKVATIFDYNQNYLKTAHPEPLQFKDIETEEKMLLEQKDALAGKQSKEGEPAWFTNLDNSLYHIRYTEIPYAELGKTPEGNAFSALKGLRVFESVKKIYVNKTRKTVYEYKEDSSFIRNTASYFLSIDFDLFRKMNETELDVYLMLIRSRAHERYKFQTMYQGIQPGELSSTGYTIDYLAKAWRLDYQYKEEERFSRLKQKLNEILASINTKAGYTFAYIRWEKARASDRFEGRPVIIYPFNAVEQEMYEKNVNARASKYYLYFLKERFREINQKEVMNQEDFRKQFSHYLWNEEIDVAGKIATMEEGHRLIFRKDMGEHYRMKIVKEVKSFINEVLTEGQQEREDFKS